MKKYNVIIGVTFNADNQREAEKIGLNFVGQLDGNNNIDYIELNDVYEAYYETEEAEAEEHCKNE